MDPEHREGRTIHAPLEDLERAIIQEFLRARGRDPDRLSELPDHERGTLLKEACLYASARLAEIEARSHFIDEMSEGPHEK